MLGYEATERLEYMVELHSARADHAGLVDALADAGLRWRLCQHGTLLMSIGRYLHDDFGERRTTISYLGWLLNL